MRSHLRDRSGVPACHTVQEGDTFVEENPTCKECRWVKAEYPVLFLKGEDRKAYTEALKKALE